MSTTLRDAARALGLVTLLYILLFLLLSLHPRTLSSSSLAPDTSIKNLWEWRVFLPVPAPGPVDPTNIDSLHGEVDKSALRLLRAMMGAVQNVTEMRGSGWREVVQDEIDARRVSRGDVYWSLKDEKFGLKLRDAPLPVLDATDEVSLRKLLDELPRKSRGSLELKMKLFQEKFKATNPSNGSHNSIRVEYWDKILSLPKVPADILLGTKLTGSRPVLAQDILDAGASAFTAKSPGAEWMSLRRQSLRFYAELAAHRVMHTDGVEGLHGIGRLGRLAVLKRVSRANSWLMAADGGMHRIRTEVSDIETSWIGSSGNASAELVRRANNFRSCAIEGSSREVVSFFVDRLRQMVPELSNPDEILGAFPDLGNQIEKRYA